MPSAITRPRASATRSARPESSASASRRKGMGSFGGGACSAAKQEGRNSIPATKAESSARLAREDFADLHAKAVPGGHQRSARHDPAVEQHVDRVAGAAAELQDRKSV